MPRAFVGTLKEKKPLQLKRSVMRTLAFIVLISSFSVSGLTSHAAEPKAERPLVKVITRAGKAHVGELVSKDGGGVTLIDLVTLRSTDISKVEISRVIEPATLAEVTTTAGIPAVTAWKLRKMSGQEAPSGKIAKVTPQFVFVTIGSSDGIAAYQSLTVYRNKGEIKDPDTGEVLATERLKICDLKVADVSKKFLKARIESDFDVSLKVGDEVELTNKTSTRVAVCPLFSSDGTLTNVGADLREEITTQLVQQKIAVVERSAILTVLPELAIQQSALFDSKTAAKLGMLTGASVVVTGKIVPSGIRSRKTGTAYIRAVDVETGEIRFATSQRVSLAGSRIVGVGSSSTSKPAPTAKEKALERSFVGRWTLLGPTGKATLYMTFSSNGSLTTNSKPPSKGKWEVVGNEVRVVMDDGQRRVIRQSKGKYSWDAVKEGAAWDSPPEASRGFKRRR